MKRVHVCQLNIESKQRIKMKNTINKEYTLYLFIYLCCCWFVGWLFGVSFVGLFLMFVADVG